MPVTVLFAVQVGSHLTISEGDLPAVYEVLGRGPDGYLPGAFVFAATGQPVVQIADDSLEFVAQQLLEAIPELAAGRPFGVGFSESPGAVHLAVSDGAVSVTSDFDAAFSAPAGQLLPAILACVERLIAFGRSITTPGEDLRTEIDALEPWLARAAAALGRDPAPSS